MRHPPPSTQLALLRAHQAEVARLAAFAQLHGLLDEPPRRAGLVRRLLRRPRASAMPGHGAGEPARSPQP